MLAAKLSTVVSFSEDTMAVVVVLLFVKVLVAGSPARISVLLSLFVTVHLHHTQLRYIITVSARVVRPACRT